PQDWSFDDYLMYKEKPDVVDKKEWEVFCNNLNLISKSQDTDCEVKMTVERLLKSQNT
ncbi:hypothetical protein ABG067_008064, partial [Albugo candida]